MIPYPDTVWLMHALNDLYTGTPYFPFICIRIFIFSKGNEITSAVHEASPPQRANINKLDSYTNFPKIIVSLSRY
jgi:hypothetical protein